MALKQRKAVRRMTPADWEHLPDEQLLQFRVRDLGLDIQVSPLAASIQALYGELEAKGVAYRPPCYLADEWLCPDRIPIIGIPFCLAHPRLKQLERKIMFEAEGDTSAECMKLLRHECGHAINYVYRLYRRTRWREWFGAFSAPYSTTYHSMPYSRRFVAHLADNYAQAHPDEDFAETFAVWLTPGSDWQTRYAEWPALGKLQYVDHLVGRIRDEPPQVPVRERPWAADRKTSTLAAYYERKKAEMGTDFKGYYDASLRQAFSASGAGDEWGPAARFLRRHRRHIVGSVTRWSGHRKYDIHELIAKLVRRCDALALQARRADPGTLIEVTALVTTLANNAWRVAPEEAHR